MVRKVKIVDAESGEELRETYTQTDRKFFWNTVTLADILKVGSIWVAIIGMVIGFDYRLKYLESDRIIVATSMLKLTEFVKSSDNFNSSYFGVQFDNGKPMNPAYKSNNKGNFNQ